MKKTILLFLQCLVLTICFSQTVGEEVGFVTRQQALYAGVVTDVATDTFLVQFQPYDISLPFAATQYPGPIKQASGKPAKEAMALGDDVESRLKVAALNTIEQWLQKCSFPEASMNQCRFRFAELADCSLYLFHTSRGYDFLSTDYHIIKIDLTAPPVQNPFFSVGLAKPASAKKQPSVIEISKHVGRSAYDENEFRNKADWTNQPQYLTDLQFCFVDERNPSFQPLREQVGKALHFLYQSCRKGKR